MPPVPNNTTPLPQNSEDFRDDRNDSEQFGTLPNNAEHFRSMRNASERKENHTLTVREVTRMFENAGVARTERSVINWCQPNRTGVARMDCYFDPNDRRYYITPQSVELAIAEEKAKAEKLRQDISEPVGEVRKSSLSAPENDESGQSRHENSGRVRTLEQEVLDLKIVNRGKDYFIEQLQKEREGLLGKLINASHKVGELETRLLQLGPSEVGSLEERAR